MGPLINPKYSSGTVFEISCAETISQEFTDKGLNLNTKGCLFQLLK